MNSPILHKTIKLAWDHKAIRPQLLSIIHSHMKKYGGFRGLNLGKVSVVDPVLKKIQGLYSGHANTPDGQLVIAWAKIKSVLMTTLDLASRDKTIDSQKEALKKIAESNLTAPEGWDEAYSYYKSVAQYLLTQEDKEGFPENCGKILVDLKKLNTEFYDYLAENWDSISKDVEKNTGAASGVNIDEVQGGGSGSKEVKSEKKPTEKTPGKKKTTPPPPPAEALAEAQPEAAAEGPAEEVAQSDVQEVAEAPEKGKKKKKGELPPLEEGLPEKIAQNAAKKLENFFKVTPMGTAQEKANRAQISRFIDSALIDSVPEDFDPESSETDVVGKGISLTVPMMGIRVRSHSFVVPYLKAVTRDYAAVIGKYYNTPQAIPGTIDTIKKVAVVDSEGNVTKGEIAYQNETSTEAPKEISSDKNPMVDEATRKKMVEVTLVKPAVETVNGKPTARYDLAIKSYLTRNKYPFSEVKQGQGVVDVEFESEGKKYTIKIPTTPLKSTSPRELRELFSIPANTRGPQKEYTALSLPLISEDKKIPGEAQEVPQKKET